VDRRRSPTGDSSREFEAASEEVASVEAASEEAASIVEELGFWLGWVSAV
jgi:hypothetical protein